jgi:hypothetical protein
MVLTSIHQSAPAGNFKEPRLESPPTNSGAAGYAHNLLFVFTYGMCRGAEGSMPIQMR